MYNINEVSFLKEPAIDPNLFRIEWVKKTTPYSMSSKHYHDYYELYYLWSGERLYFIKNRTYHVHQGDLVLINVNEIHKTLEAGSDSHERILIYFHEEFIKDLLVDENYNPLTCFSGAKVIRPEKQDTNVIENLLFRMIDETKKNLPETKLYLRVLLLEMLITLHRLQSYQEDDSAEFPGLMHKKVSEIVRYINDHYAQHQSLKIVAAKFNISPYYLSRIFNKATGFSFVEYLNSIRVKEAQKLLKETSLTITEIAEKVGYESLTHFGRVFKSITGLSPMKYRKSTQHPL